MIDCNELDQFLEDCASTQVGSVTLKIRRFQAGDDTVTDELWIDLLEQLRDQAAVVLSNFPAISREQDPDDVINSLYERLTRILAGEVIKIRHRGDFFKSAYRNFWWHIRDIRKKKSPVRLLIADDDDDVAHATPLIASDIGPAENAERTEIFLLVLEEIENLPEDLREIFDLHFGGLSFRRIEELIGVPKSTAKEKWTRAKAVLAQKLESSAGISRMPAGEGRLAG